MQVGLGRSALAAGLILLPFAAGSVVASSFSDRVADRLGRWVLLLGSGLVLVGIVGVILTARLAGTAVTGVELLPSLLVAGVGSGLVIAPNVDIVLSGVSWREAGAASGVLNTSQRLGNTLGVAIVGNALFGALENGRDWSQAIQLAALYALGAVLLTFLLVFLLPGQQQEPQDR